MKGSFRNSCDVFIRDRSISIDIFGLRNDQFFGDLLLHKLFLRGFSLRDTVNTNDDQGQKEFQLTSRCKECKGGETAVNSFGSNAMQPVEQ